jgi:putative ABC transport system permease protein
MKAKNGVGHLIASALSDFRRSKVRTILTSLGITIGVLSVVMLIALGLGLKNYIQQQFENLGTNLILVIPGNAFGGEGGAQSFGPGFVGGVQFDERDVTNIRRLKEVSLVAPTTFKSTSITANGKKRSGYIMGTNEDYFELLNVEIDKGDKFSISDIQSSAKNVVLGSSMADYLFGNADNAVGKTVRFNDQRFKVIGVAKKKGDNEMDNSAILPYKTTFGSINPNKTFFSLYLGVRSEEEIPLAKDKVKEVLAKRYDEDEFSVTEQSEVLSTVNQIFGVINAVLVAIGSISLLVGGIGIMNIMYATVTERTKEVGIRRAVGATERDILLQFLAESVILSLMGGALGLILATVIVLGIRAFFPASINVFSVIVTLLISSGIGIFFGVFPARRAAKLPPIEAIRYE